MKKIILLALIHFFASLNLYSQYYFYVSIPSENELARPNARAAGMSSDIALNQIFSEFGVVGFQQAFPGAQNAKLRSFYTIRFAENNNRSIDSFESLLKNSGVFDAVYRGAYYELAVCSNPVPINDAHIINGWINNNALDLLNAQCAWTITRGDPNVIVAVIDTEFDTNHEDMIETFVGVVGTRTHPTNHGTSVSSAVAIGTNNGIGIAGIGYNTRVKGYYVNGGTLWDGIWQAYLDGIRIINVSWAGSAGTPARVLAAEEMAANGTVLVFAAGNYLHQTHSHREYANIPGVIVVSGVDANNTHGGTGGVAHTHVHNTWVDVVALSMGVTLALPGSLYTGYGNGTSFAAPQVAGVVALMRSINPNLTPAEIEDIIKATADPIADGHLFPGLLGAGRVNAYSAVRATLATICVYTFANEIVSENETVWGCERLEVENVTVTNNARLELNATGTTRITGPFRVELGSTLRIGKQKISNLF